MRSSARSEESRSFLQKRLALLYRVGFAISALFLVGVVVVRGFVGDGIDVELRSVSRWFHLVATLFAGLFWYLVSLRTLRRATLELIDAIGIIGLILLLNMNAGLFEIRTVAVFNLVLTTGIALVLRAVVVPSTARRTLVLGLVGSLSAAAVFLFSAIDPRWPVKQSGLDDWPLAFQAISLGLWLGALVTTATIASRVIFNLRHDVRAARKLGQYVLGDKLGEGGMGIVYRATHAMLRRKTALKLLPPDRVDELSLRRFEREVVQTARLCHPNTVAIYDYGHTPDGVFYYAMEYLDGLTIGQLVEREGPLAPGRVVRILAQVCASLEEAHAMGLVHRDIKPANIMVVGHTAAYDLVKVVDFGLVKRLETAETSMQLSNYDKILGTPLYLAPESITDPDQVDGRSDLYALSAVGYYMLTGQDVFEGTSIFELCAAHLHGVPIPPHERLGRPVPPDLEALILKGLAKAPDDRPASAARFREALLRCHVAPWTDDDARAWWQKNGTRPDFESESASALEMDAKTITVAVDFADGTGRFGFEESSSAPSR